MRYGVLLDFGSTYTKVVCVDLKENRTVMSDKYPSTVHVDAEIALNKCFAAAKKTVGEEEFEKALKLSTSSAAGGLRIAVSGLTKTLSNAAGRNACFSAGGKLVHTSTGRLTDRDIEEIQQSQAEIILLCGGYEKGNYDMVVENAQTLAESCLRIPVIYAGNSKAASQIRTLFALSGKECFTAENIIPDVGVLNTEPTIDIIRNLFMTRITNMKGVGKVAGQLDGPVVPTPAAVLKAGELLSRGTGENEGIGNFMIVDVGGATTDIYSYTEDDPYIGAKRIGAGEPYAKRTVEGDMGMRESAVCLMEEMGAEKFARECGISPDEAEEAVLLRNTHREYISETEKEQRIDDCIAKNAIAISARRHAGYLEKGFLNGVSLLQYGKNLCDISKVIGTGGIIVNAADPFSRLNEVKIRDKEKGIVLLPEKIDCYVDRDYVFYAAGLLADQYPEVAVAIMKDSIGIK